MTMVAPKQKPTVYYRFVVCPDDAKEEADADKAKLYKDTPKRLTQPMLLCTLLICDPLPDDVTIQRWDDATQHWVWCTGAEMMTLILAADATVFKWDGA